jgi:hypothetical protein
METQPNTLNIEIRPPKKIVIHNIIQMDLETMIKSIRTPSGNMPLMWANGFVFVLNAIPLQSKAIDLYLEGEMHFSDVLFCVYKEYTQTININEFEITNIMDMSKSIVHNAIAQALQGVSNADVANTAK